jgi:hypothetical protein
MMMMKIIKEDAGMGRYINHGRKVSLVYRVWKTRLASLLDRSVGSESGDKRRGGRRGSFFLQSSGSSNPSTTTFHFHLPSKNP